MQQPSQPLHMDPKLVLQRKLASPWSSPELAALLQTRPGLLSDTLCIFRGLDQPVRLRVLLAFLAFDDISMLPKESVLAVLDEAAADPDEWVKVMSAVVRDWVFGSPEGEQPPSADVAAEVLAKCKLLELDSSPSSLSTPGEGSSLSAGGGGARAMEPEPYFCPIEYLYLAEPIVQRLHRAAPLSRREHGHFTVGELGEVEMPPISDNHQHKASLSSSTASLQPAPAPSTTSHRPPPLPSASAAAAPAAARPRLQLPPGVGARGGGAAGSLLGALGAQRQSMMAEKPRLKVIKLDDVKVKTNHAKVAASNEALSLEFGTQPLAQTTTINTPSMQQPPPQPAALSSEAEAANKKRPAAAVAEAPAATAAAAAATDPLADYHRMKAKANRLTPQDDERIRLFYLHAAQGSLHPLEGQQSQEVKIKLNEEEVVRSGDGARVKETLYLTLNYETRKAVLSRKVSKPKTAAP